MPPKKRARTTTTSATSPAPSLGPSASSDATPLNILKRSHVISRPATPSSFPTSPSDPWTTAQETALFKALIRYKPTGIHKHFHMLCISSFLRSHGHTLLPPPHGQQQERLVSHTRIAGIWEKLSALFDLEILDEREDQYALAAARAKAEDRQEDEDVEDSGEEWVKEFTLPESDGLVRRSMLADDDDEDEEEASFADMMWQRRFVTQEEEIPSSPPEMLVFRGRDGIVEDMRVSTSPAPTAESTRTRKRASRGGAAGPPVTTTRRQSTLQTAGRASRRSSRFDSEAKSSPAPTQGDDEGLSEEDEEGAEGVEDEEEEREGSEKTTKSTKARLSLGSRRGRSERGKGRGGSIASSRGKKR